MGPGALLRLLGQFVHEQETWFEAGHTVLVAETGQTYAPGTLVSAALLRTPDAEPAELDEFAMEGIPCRFLWVFPITEAETELKLERGVEALLELIADRGLGYVTDPGRACLVTGWEP